MRQEDLGKIAKAAAVFGVQYRHAAGADMLVLAREPSGRRAVHLVLSRKKLGQIIPRQRRNWELIESSMEFE